MIQLSGPLLLLADTAGQIVQDWRVIAIVTLGGLLTLIIKQRADGKERQQESRRTDEKVDQLDGKVNEVHAQVTNGGSNLAETIGEMKRMLGIIKEGQRVLHDDHLGPIHKTMAGLGEDVRQLRGELRAESAARAELDARVRADHAQRPSTGDR